MNKLEGVKMLWSVAHYDGPCTGVAEYEDRKYYFDIRNSIEDDTREYALYPITKAEYKDEWIKHAAFNMLVGTHCNFNKNNNRCGKAWPWQKTGYSIWNKLGMGWGAERKRYTARKPVGWFIRD